MSNLQALQTAVAARQTITRDMLSAAWTEARASKTADPTRPIDAAEQAVFAAVQSAPDLLADSLARTRFKRIMNMMPRVAEGAGSTGTTTALPVRGGQAVFVSAEGFALNAAGQKPTTPAETARTLLTVGRNIQASYGQGNVFASLSTAQKEPLVAQMQKAVADIAAVPAEAKGAVLLGSIAACNELIKSLTIDARVVNSAEIKLRDAAFAIIKTAMAHESLDVLQEAGLWFYMQSSNALQKNLSTAQKGDIKSGFDALVKPQLVDYSAWDQAGKSTIVMDKASGPGEGFMKGYGKQLIEEGLNPNDPNAPKFKLISGDPDAETPCVFKCVIPKGSQYSKWDRDMTIEIRLRPDRNDRFINIDKPGIDIIGYGGHSSFGRSIADSLTRAPKLFGDKLLVIDECCAIGSLSRIARHEPELALNMVGSVNSSYFRKQDGYASESEGFLLDVANLRVLMQRGTRADRARELQMTANWGGHTSPNNWFDASDKRFWAALDRTGNGVPDALDALPTFDVTDIKASTAKEFEFAIPPVPAAQIGAVEQAQAIADLNTFANYNDVMSKVTSPYNNERRVIVDPSGAYFPAADKPNRLTSWTVGQNGEYQVQFSTVCADMTPEALRMISFYDAVDFLAEQGKLRFANKGERVAMGLVFVAAALQFDRTFRDTELFTQFKKLYQLPADVQLYNVESARTVAENGHTHSYCGDMSAVAALLNGTPSLNAASNAGSTIGKCQFAFV